ncbi:unnamed protein product [Allacma fusca]|uniref:P53 and DNA damage-regulated protein 1 n=1 Tax=Allacma fusca TaxID=39272 RepID=A0A8J2P881_9HEXA|nr:unnamed protein product [Allacma fusca]
MTDKRTVIDLDRRRNDNRVALRQLGKSKENKSWLVMGNTFFRLETSEAKSVIEKDQKETDDQINKLRNGMKEKMEKIYDIEGKSMVKGFDLQPLNAEVKAMLPEMKWL